MNHDYSKWNNYTIGNVSWINKRKDHLCRKKFIEYILKSSFKNILEIGAGEVLGGQKIRKIRPDIDYNILDISDTFLKNAKKLGFNVFKGEMHKTNFRNKEFDLVYGCSILEHSPDLNKTFNELKRISKSFYFTMFKWRQKTGSIKSNYNSKRNYFTTEFNINKLFNLLSIYGTIKKLLICTEDGKVVKYEKYIKTLGNLDFHRNGNYISIVGDFND